MTRAVILAAGDGGRLAEHTHDQPKPLIRAAGRPLIDYTLEALSQAGVDEVLVVVGYRADQLKAGITASRLPDLRVRYVTNSRFAGGASLSLRAAQTDIGGEPFLLLMADHMLSATIVQRLLSEPPSERISLVATDASAWPQSYNEEATRVTFVPGTRQVAAIGKGLNPWDALDTGAFLLAPSIWEAVERAPEDCELSVVFQDLARRGELAGVDVSGASWYDVDTVDDLEAAQRVVAGGTR